jgi:hypothetical protein
MSKKVYLVSLTGQGDHYRIIVEKNVWDWIHSKPVFKAGEYCVDEFFPDIGRVNVTIGSW